MSTIRFLLNRSEVSESADPGRALLDVIRRRQRLTGCKEACLEGDCGACLVLLGKIEQSRLVYRPATACLIPLAAVAGQHVVTIEGLNGEGLNPIQQALAEQGGIQCGFCTPGIVVALTAFFLNSPCSDADAAIDAAAGNLCRCTGYQGVKRAIHQLCAQFDLMQSMPESRLRDCIQWQLLPPYFGEIAERLRALPVTEILEDKRQALLVAGGSDLMVQDADRLSGRPLRFLPLTGSAEDIRIQAGRCRIAATTTIEQLRTSPRLQTLLPTLGEDLKLLCSAPIRQRATIGGNLVHASPIADLAVLFLALDADLLLERQGQQRRLSLRKFFAGYKQTACRQGECLLEISFECPESPMRFSFEKVSKREYLDIASVNSALSVRLSATCAIDEIHLSAGGVAAIPLYLSATCEYLHGKAVKPEILLAAGAIAQTEISPISDLRGSAEYKRLLFRQLLFAHFLKLFPELISWEALHATG